MRSILSLTLWLLTTMVASATTWHVGPSRTHTLPSAVQDSVRDGDTVLLDDASYGDVCVWNANDLTIIGSGASVIKPTIGAAAAACWRINGSRCTVRGISFEDTRTMGPLSSAVHITGELVTIESCLFLQNATSIRVANGSATMVTITACAFLRSDSVDVDVDAITSMSLHASWFRGGAVRACVRSHARSNVIENCLFSEGPVGTSAYVDLSMGGFALLTGNIFVENAPTAGIPNATIIRYATDPTATTRTDNTLIATWNTIVNERGSMAVITVAPTPVILATIKNSIVIGARPLVEGQLSTSPLVVDSAANYRGTTVLGAGFVDPTKLDYQLLGTSPARSVTVDANVAPAAEEYVHPVSVRPRATSMTVGAYEYRPPVTPIGKVWLVGPQRAYKSPHQLTTLVGDGDTIIVDAAIYTDSACIWTANALTFLAAGEAIIESNGVLGPAHALWECRGTPVTIRGFTFRFCSTDQGDGTGLYLGKTKAQLTKCTFVNDQRAVVGNGDATASLRMDACDVQRHLMTAAYPLLTMGNGTDVTIASSSIIDESGQTVLRTHTRRTELSWCKVNASAPTPAALLVDVQAGGHCLLWGNSLRSGSTTDTTTLLRFRSGAEVDSIRSDVWIGFNTAVSATAHTIFVRADSALLNSLHVRNNFLVGPDMTIRGRGMEITDTVQNLRVPTIGEAGFRNSSSVDYRLRDDSPAQSAAVAPGKYVYNQADGTAIYTDFTPAFEYVDPLDTRKRISWSDIGAYENAELMSVDESDALRSALRIDPNPAASYAGLTIGDAYIGSDIIIMNMQGGEVARYRATEPHMVIDTHDLPSAMYVVRCGTSSVLLSIIR